MADSNRCQGQCHVGGSQEFIDDNVTPDFGGGHN